jgi:hypothetical protein
MGSLLQRNHPLVQLVKGNKKTPLKAGLFDVNP